LLSDRKNGGKKSGGRKNGDRLGSGDTHIGRGPASRGAAWMT
jgi:hypothetical protein